MEKIHSNDPVQAIGESPRTATARHGNIGWLTGSIGEKRMATPRIQSVDRAFTLLACIARRGGKESLPTIAAECGLSVATAHRLLATMETLGAVVHTAPGQYRIELGVLELGRHSTLENLLAATADASLRRVTQSIAPTAHLGMLDGDFMVTYIAKSHRRGHMVPTRIGSKLEAYCSALGKVLLASQPESCIETYLTEAPFVPLTQHTITDPTALSAELEQVRAQGFGIDNGELYDDLCCVAVPIRDAAGKTIAALSASSPATDMSGRCFSEMADALQRHADDISRRLFPALLCN